MTKLARVHDRHWRYIETLLPSDVEQTALACGALRRCRGIPNAHALLRIVLAYGTTDLSLKGVATWAKALNVASLTSQGLFYRLCHAEKWLESVLASVLAQQVPAEVCRLRLRIVDATTLTGPGADRPDWRLHVVSDPASGRFTSVRITTEKGAESFSLHPLNADDVVVGDRGYAIARGIHAAVEAGAHVIVRFHPYSIRLCGLDRAVRRVCEWEADVPEIGGINREMLLPVPPKPMSSKPGWSLKHAAAWIPVRAIAARTSAGTITWLLTTLPEEELSIAEAMAIYRLRWQIELFFKRIKSLLEIDTLPSRHGPTARTWILARLIACALAQQLLEPNGSLSPWGYRIPSGTRA
jgi:hypothetical protein